MNFARVDHHVLIPRRVHVAVYRYPLPLFTDASHGLGCVGGYSRVKTVINNSRPTKKNSLFLNAGDEFQVNHSSFEV